MAEIDKDLVVTDVYVVTGASSNLGLELSKVLLKSGKKCIFIVRDKQGLKSLTDFDDKNFDIWEGDLEDETHIDEVCQRLTNYDRDIWSFIHIAAVSSEDDFDALNMCKTFIVNVFSGWQIAKTCVEKMGSFGGGRILFIGSIGHKFGGKIGKPGYSSSKYLLEYFPKYFRVCASQNVLINTLQLGVMNGGTQLVSGVTDSDFIKRVNLIPTGKEVSHAEAVKNILFLCSKENKSIHNTVLNCSGGE